MTDMQHKPNGWNVPLNRMTEEEWKEYFRLREELDVEYTEAEIDEALLKINEYLKNKQDREAEELLAKIPTDPRLAYKIKIGLGLKEVMYLNLSDAKKEFPGEF